MTGFADTTNRATTCTAIATGIVSLFIAASCLTAPAHAEVTVIDVPDAVQRAQKNGLLDLVQATSRETGNPIGYSLYMLEMESTMGENLTNDISSARGVSQITDSTFVQMIRDHGEECLPAMIRLDPKHAPVFARVLETVKKGKKASKKDLINLRMKSHASSLLLVGHYNKAQVVQVREKLAEKKSSARQADDRVIGLLVHLFGANDAVRLLCASSGKKLGDVIPVGCSNNKIPGDMTVDTFFKIRALKWMKNMDALAKEAELAAFVQKRITGHVSYLIAKTL